MKDPYINAIEFVQKAHSGQIRKKTGLPYVAHVYGVAACLESRSCSMTVLIAALCHDILEKTYIPVETIEDRFGTDVAQIVMDCTDQVHLKWEDRKKEALSRYARSGEESQMVFLADKLDSLRQLLYLLKQRDTHLLKRHYKRSMEDYSWYYNKVWENSPEKAKNVCFKSVLKDYKKKLHKLNRLLDLRV